MMRISAGRRGDRKGETDDRFRQVVRRGQPLTQPASIRGPRSSARTNASDGGRCFREDPSDPARSFFLQAEHNANRSFRSGPDVVRSTPEDGNDRISSPFSECPRKGRCCVRPEQTARGDSVVREEIGAVREIRTPPEAEPLTAWDRRTGLSHGDRTIPSCHFIAGDSMSDFMETVFTVTPEGLPAGVAWAVVVPVSAGFLATFA